MCIECMQLMCCGMLTHTCVKCDYAYLRVGAVMVVRLLLQSCWEMIFHWPWPHVEHFKLLCVVGPGPCGTILCHDFTPSTTSYYSWITSWVLKHSEYLSRCPLFQQKCTAQWNAGKNQHVSILLSVFLLMVPSCSVSSSNGLRQWTLPLFRDFSQLWCISAGTRILKSLSIEITLIWKSNQMVFFRFTNYCTRCAVSTGANCHKSLSKTA